MGTILVACERSGVVRDAFAAAGHEAWSCDLHPSDSPRGNHFTGDVFTFLDCCSRGLPVEHLAGALTLWETVRLPRRFDMMIAHPECKYLTVTANRSFLNNPVRWQQRLDAMMFVWRLWNLPIERIVIENPVGVISTHIGKPNQYIQPYWFGHPYSKKTGLWIKGNVPLLRPTNKVEPKWVYHRTGGKRMSPQHYYTARRSYERAKTEPGVAAAMADQWGSMLKECNI